MEEQKKALRSMYKKIIFPTLIGIEIEGFVYDENNRRVDVYKWIKENGGDEKIVIDEIGTIKTDAGIHQIEFNIMQSTNTDEIFQRWFELLAVLPKNWHILYLAEDPYINASNYEKIKQIWCNKDRYKAIWDALSQESKEWHKVLYMCKYSSVHIHINIEPDSAEGIRLINFFNMNAYKIWSKFAYPENNCRYFSWHGWARKERLPYNKPIFVSNKDLRLYFASIPRLIKSCEDKWSIDLKNSSIPGDVVSEGTIWWWCRPRWSLNTIEIRIFDSVPVDGLYSILSYINTALKILT